MITLIADTAGQTAQLSLAEGATLLSETYTHYLMIITREENADSGMSLAQVLTVVSENQNWTTVTLTTASLKSTGRYHYEVYGQNSDSNLDPEDESVVGEIERGLVWMTDSTEYFRTLNQTIPEDYRAGQE